MVICLERGADLHMAQLMPLPLTVSCFSKIQIGFTFLVPAHPGSPGHRAVKRVCVCVCVQSVKENFLKYWEHIFNKPDIISCSLSNHSTHVICCDTCNADHSTCRGWKLFVTSVMGSSTVVTSAPAPLHFIPVTFSLEIFSPTPKLPGMLLLLYLYVVLYHYHTFLVC